MTPPSRAPSGLVLSHADVAQHARAGGGTDDARTGVFTLEPNLLASERGQNLCGQVVTAVLTATVVAGQDEQGRRALHHHVADMRVLRPHDVRAALTDLDAQLLEAGYRRGQARCFRFAPAPLFQATRDLGVFP